MPHCCDTSEQMSEHIELASRITVVGSHIQWGRMRVAPLYSLIQNCDAQPFVTFTSLRLNAQSSFHVINALFCTLEMDQKQLTNRELYSCAPSQ